MCNKLIDEIATAISDMHALMEQRAEADAAIRMRMAGVIERFEKLTGCSLRLRAEANGRPMHMRAARED